MRSKHSFISIIWLVLMLQLVTARTVLHRRTEIDADGEKHTKTWTTHEADEDFSSAAGAADDGFQTFSRNGITLRIKPQVTTLRIGGKNVSPEQLLEQAKHSKELELLAVRQLMSTGQPVKRTNIENGRKHTSIYTLEPDGSIVCKKVEDIDLADVERRFEEIIKQQQAKQNPNKLSDWEWAEDDKPSAETPVLRAPQQPTQANKPNQPAGRPVWASPSAARRPTPAADDNFGGGGAPLFKHNTQLPNTWHSDSWDKDDPFSPPELPAFGAFDDDWNFEDPPVPTDETNTFTNTHTDKDGNTVHTSYTTGPNEWKRKTVKISSNFQPKETTTLRSLEEFLKSQYNPSNDAPPLLPSSAATTSTTPQPVKTINIEDLQPVAVLNINKPADEQFLHPLGPNAGEQKPIKTLKIDNIPPTPDLDDPRVELTKVRTLTKTFNSNHPPSSADLDPNMLDILKRAGIRPEDISNSNGHTITKTRTEPDGRIVTTTYRVRPTYGVNSFEPLTHVKPYHVSSFRDSPYAAQNPIEIPSFLDAPQLSKHHSASHFGVDFTPFSAVPLDESSTTTTTRKSLVRDREPLHPELEDVEGAVTLNPLLIHPVDSATPASASAPKICAPKTRTGKSAIVEFLAKIGISVADLDAQNGELIKTIVDDDGRTLTARFVLSAPVASKCDK
ncbi:PREDICTED: uncharacterized protein LOC108368365 [Rhagoletis zephyria]|uniref:uncharacterized protein LOC108368365 n=1 Tax=Rhagoletis zephyria TaxID=28612 RepID=UPI0008114044|nr:PREDICTED: uncharacterized protein LOC108368365 [Rhagoletis zephyria]